MIKYSKITFFLIPMLLFSFNTSANDTFNNLSSVKKSRVCSCIGLFSALSMLMKGNDFVSKQEMQKINKQLLLSLMPNMAAAQSCFIEDPKLLGFSLKSAQTYKAQGNEWEQTMLCTLNLVDWKIMIPPR